MNTKELGRQDKVNLLRMGIGRGILDEQTEAYLLSSEPSMEKEFNDLYKASTFSFKFVAFKTPLHMP